MLDGSMPWVELVSAAGRAMGAELIGILGCVVVLFLFCAFMLASLSWHLGRAAPVVARRLPLIPLRHRCHSCTKVSYNTIRLVQRENPATWHLILDKDFTEKWLPPPVRISHCDNPHCRTCAVLRETRPAVRTLNHGWMEEGELSCRSKNLVYALQCRGCGILYVGETGRELRQRLSSHLQIKGNGPMSIHYRNDAEVCPLCTDNSDSDDTQRNMSLDNFDVVILESLFFDGEQYMSPLEEARIRRARERWWMQELHTVWPSGLNKRGHRLDELLLLRPRTAALVSV